jgi:hypothetical protein
LALSIVEVRAGKLDPKLANSISYLGAGFLRAIEAADLEQKRQSTRIPESAKQCAEGMTTSPIQVLNLLGAIAEHSLNDSVRVAAATSLCHVFGLRSNHQDAREMFDGWSDEELRAYAETGIPPRFPRQDEHTRAVQEQADATTASH